MVARIPRKRVHLDSMRDCAELGRGCVTEGEGTLRFAHHRILSQMEEAIPYGMTRAVYWATRQDVAEEMERD